MHRRRSGRSPKIGRHGHGSRVSTIASLLAYLKPNRTLLIWRQWILYLDVQLQQHRYKEDPRAPRLLSRDWGGGHVEPCTSHPLVQAREKYKKDSYYVDLPVVYLQGK